MTSRGGTEARAAKGWILAKEAVMVLGKAPDLAVGWNTKQEIEAEVW